MTLKNWSDTVALIESYQDFADSKSADLGWSEWFDMNQETINGFADVTGDHQWIHVDPAAAADGPFGGTIAHGFLVLALLPRFSDTWIDVKDSPMAINYGLNKVRFPTPVRAGKRVRATAAVIDVEEVSDGHQATVEVKVFAEGSDKPSCVAEWVYRAYAPALESSEGN